MRNFNIFNLIFVLAVALSFFLVLNSDARAQSVCDGESGAAYGLCNAYCDAMDCDGSDGGPNASDKACDRVADNFTKITGGSLPCDEPISCGFNMTTNTCGGGCPTGRTCQIVSLQTCQCIEGFPFP